ncbi:alpha/beta hydrolase [Asticcacaulis sp. EMRT-3]|uniref:alpha/beta hydrolase n=1 Tax=Asticcacaulis sp. EMRT-3 TaxID=3040349 RepID=UPI0024AF614C|nr:alpha/beta hydrolase [Asticcacaulis sp. EMRT-3]MDI7773848.1 alpha/beta hydrolase [Asticcacaulis sp. EMRT-3]
MTDLLNQEPQWLDAPNGDRIAYRRLKGDGPLLLWLGGFLSDMRGSKIAYLSEQCRREGRAFLCFDYYAHGETGGDFAAASVGRWRDNMLAVVDALTEGPVTAIGSSMGAHMLCLLMQARPGKVKAAGFVAPAPDFATKLMLAGLNPEDRRQYEVSGAHSLPGYDRPVALSQAFFADAAQHEVLNASIAFDGPVRILHGMKDDVVPWQHGVRLLDSLTTPDVRLELIKDGDHRLSRTNDLELLGRMAREF